ncbi:MAG: tyrosine--tRNA ligase, partial [Proteobacteria bacterium]|nr:tyrosine--tRNA ligase [Pseudomonadota bacterium]
MTDIRQEQPATPNKDLIQQFRTFMHFLDELSWRGLLQDVSDEAGLRKLGAGERFYVGADPTAPSLHFGHLLVLLTAMRVARYGLEPIILFGGSTGFIGDPTGRRTERVLLDPEIINSNVQSLSTQVRTIFERVGVKATFVNNYDWTKGVSVLEFLRETGKYLTVNYMLAKDSVSARMESDSGISFTEFSYMLLQAFDFFHLHQFVGCKIQFGGSDQWGNITAGLELIRKKAHGEAYAFSIPLLLDSTGKKMGKSEGSPVFLDPKLFSPYRFHQYLLNTADADVVRLLKMATFLTREEIAALETEMQAHPERRSAQKALADAVCNIVHGEEATAGAIRSAEVLFGGGSLAGLSDTQLSEIFSEVPSTEIARGELARCSAFDLFVRTGISKSKGEARRL